jgi:hypothetical protein
MHFPSVGQDQRRRHFDIHTASFASDSKLADRQHAVANVTHMLVSRMEQIDASAVGFATRY